MRQMRAEAMAKSQYCTDGHRMSSSPVLTFHVPPANRTHLPSNMYCEIYVIVLDAGFVLQIDRVYRII